MQKKSLIKGRAATKKALIASRKGTTGKVSTANVAAGVAAARSVKTGSVANPSAAIRTGSVMNASAAVKTGVVMNASAAVKTGVVMNGNVSTGCVMNGSVAKI